MERTLQVRTGAPRSLGRTPEFPVELLGVDELHAAFLKGKPHTLPSVAPRAGNPGTWAEEEGAKPHHCSMLDGFATALYSQLKLFIDQ
jgi:hypothetical protein